MKKIIRLLRLVISDSYIFVESKKEPQDIL